MNPVQMEKDQIKKLIIKRNGLTIECFFTKRGTLQGKIEHYGGNSTEFAYQFDSQGHLCKVLRDASVVESYTYNQAGQRVEQKREYRGFSDSTSGLLYYDKQGRLARAGDTSFYYSKEGALAERCDCQGITKFSYGKDTLLDRVIRPSRANIRYEYDKTQRIVPARRFRNGCLAAEYIWRNALQLSGYLDHDHQLEYVFLYDSQDILDRVRITPLSQDKVWKPGPDVDLAAASSDWLGNMVMQKRKERLHAIFGKSGKAVDLRCGTDQVGTLKILTDMNGRLVKEIQRDSFGRLLFDSFPDLFMPIGFAGGLEDPDTRLVHFGYRDYDPTIGRFTAPDPLGDTGGDHDLYDYCIDDPVTMNDPAGLFPPLLLFLGGKALALALGLGGAYGAAKIVDTVKSSRDGEESTAARDAIKTVAPKVAGASAVSALPGVAVMAPGALTAAGQRIGAAVQSSAHAEKIIAAGRFAEGFVNPNPSVAPTLSGGLGTVAAELVKKFKNWQNSSK